MVQHFTCHTTISYWSPKKHTFFFIIAPTILKDSQETSLICCLQVAVRQSMQGMNPYKTIFFCKLLLLTELTVGELTI